MLLTVLVTAQAVARRAVVLAVLVRLVVPRADNAVVLTMRIVDSTH